MKAAFLYSGGLDSTIGIAMLLEHGYEVYPIIMDDGSTKNELKLIPAVEYWMGHFGLQRNLIKAKYLNKEEIRGDNGYVPGWKLTMIMTAFAYCESLGINNLYLGYLNDDRFPYSDEGPEAFDSMSNFYEMIYGKRIEIRTLMNFTKSEIIQWAMERNMPLEMTFSCRQVVVAGITHCGRCDVCKMRYKAFEDAGYKDPAYYVTLDHIHEPLKGGQRLGYEGRKIKNL